MSFFALMDNGLVTVWVRQALSLGQAKAHQQPSSEEESWEKGCVRGALGKAEAGS